MIFNMSCALEIPEMIVGRFRLCFTCLVSFCLFCFSVLLEDEQKISAGEFDRSIFRRLTLLVLVHLRCVSLVILVLYASFVCFQDHRTCLTKGCILE